jgi:hypothetical protein
VNQTSGRTFGPGLTVARHLEGPLAGYFEVRRGQQLRVTVGGLGTLCGAERRRLQGVDISLDGCIQPPKTSRHQEGGRARFCVGGCTLDGVKFP